jgi:hypothetical protein
MLDQMLASRRAANSEGKAARGESAHLFVSRLKGGCTDTAVVAVCVRKRFFMIASSSGVGFTAMIN